MQRLIPLPFALWASVLLLAACVAAQEPNVTPAFPLAVAPGTVRIEVSDAPGTLYRPGQPIPVGRWVFVRVAGHEAVDGVALSWQAWPSGQVELVGGSTNVPTGVMLVRAMSPGRAAIFAPVMLPDNPQPLLLGVELQFGEDDDVVPPPPPPPPPPPVPGERFVVVIAETAAATPATRKVEYDLAIYLQQAGHDRRYEDPNLVGANGKTPEWFAFYLAEVKKRGVKLPAIVVADPAAYIEDCVLAIEPMPKTAAAAIQLVKKHGG